MDHTRKLRPLPFFILPFILPLVSACSSAGDATYTLTPPRVRTEVTFSDPASGEPAESPEHLEPLDESILPSLSPSFIARWEAGNASLGDRQLVDAIQSGKLTRIDGLHFDTLPETENPIDAPPGLPAYVYIHPDSGDESFIAWFEPESGYVIELSTGFPLNVRSNPGTGAERKPNGALLYRYGFAWYPRWERILPEPVIQLIEDFYTDGVDHVRTSMDAYRSVTEVADTSSDLNRLDWSDALPREMLAWGTDLPAPPFIGLPDSETVDIREELFEKALYEGLVRVDEASVERYRLSPFPAQSWFSTDQNRDAIVGKLTSPLQSPSQYSDLEKAIILGAIFDGRGPLVISIDFGLEGGYFVPDSGEKELRIAPREVNLMFGYEGVYHSKFPHELAHIVEARDYPFIDERCWPHEADMKETLKYMLEFMWWVRQDPVDAPTWQWGPVNSGLTLARLLTGYFPNSDC